MSEYVITTYYTVIGNSYLLVAQMLEEVPKDFEGLYSDAFALRGHELVDYPEIDTSSKGWQQAHCLDRIKYSPADEKALHWLADNHFPSGRIYISIK